MATIVPAPDSSIENVTVRRSLWSRLFGMGASKMPKPGVSSVTIPQSTYSQLVELAKSRHETISSLLVQLVNCTVLSTVQPVQLLTDAGASTVRTVPIAQNASESSPKGEILVRPPGFEPGFPAVSLFEWEAGVIDQVAHQHS